MHAMNFTWPSLGPIMPEILLLGFGVLLIIVEMYQEKQRDTLPWLTIVGALTTMLMLAIQQNGNGFGGMFVIDGYSRFFKFVCLTGVIFCALMSERNLKSEGIGQGEYYSLVVFSAAGMMLMASAGDLTVLYLGLELMALSVYCLVGLPKRDLRANEAAIKYFLMGGFSTALMLYGISLVYGLTGTTNIAGIAKQISALGLQHNIALYAGIALMLCGLCFKVAAAPFHFWTPDVYEGAPTSVTAFMSAAPKAAAFAIFGRVLMQSFPGLQEHWGSLLAAIALLTMAIGNITALSQTSIKRMLAYSSVAHAGYALLGLLAGSAEGLSATMNYLLIYTCMNMGAFAVLILMAGPGQRREKLDDYRGLAKNNPLLAMLMLLFMFSLTGLPPTAGFIGKFYLLQAALRAGYTGTVIAAVIFSAISAFFYLRVVRLMYMETPAEEYRIAYSPGLTTALALTMTGVMGLGLLPGTVLTWASRALLGQ